MFEQQSIVHGQHSIGSRIRLQDKQFRPNHDDAVPMKLQRLDKMFASFHRFTKTYLRLQSLLQVRHQTRENLHPLRL